ncbi:MAG: metallophosphoesterase family protein [Lachnospiraceae bacterium]|nr:metallophosphoesterase family protein [Lachnospiraceae bacterium]
MRFTKNGTLKILQLTDIHYVEGNETDRKTANLVKKLIEWERPDLIVLTGDTVYGEGNIKMVPEIFGLIAGYGIPWTFVFGNHDDEEIGNRAELFKEVVKLPGCLAYDDQTAGAGVGNHVVDITDESGKIVWRLMLIDSGNYLNGNSEEGYDFIKESQIKWYESKVRENAGGAVAFFHIPLQEYEEAWRGKHVGHKNEGICASQVNTGLAESMVSDGVTRAVFAGHDHINDYIGVYKSILLGYGRATGYNTYGEEGFKHGGRVILLSEDDPKGFETWVRLDDGSIEDDFRTSVLTGH